MRRFLGGLLLGGCLMMPVQIIAGGHPHRYYDPYRKDYHEWNEAEERAYRHWLTEERHHEYHDWAHANKRERNDYWRWRHEHMDWH